MPRAIRVGDRVRVTEPGQPVRYGVVTAIEALNDHYVFDIACDGIKLLAMPTQYVELA